MLEYYRHQKQLISTDISLLYYVNFITNHSRTLRAIYQYLHGAQSHDILIHLKVIKLIQKAPFYVTVDLNSPCVWLNYTIM